VLAAEENSPSSTPGKIIDAPSIVVASTATNWFGQEGRVSSICLLTLDRAGGAGRAAGDVAGVRVAVHGDGCGGVRSGCCDAATD